MKNSLSLKILFLVIIANITLLASPTAPSNLSLKALSNKSVSISWRDNSGGVDGFKIFRDGKLIALLKHGVTSYVDSGLKPNTTYEYTIKATDNKKYVVSTHGDDNALGDETHPFKTIQKALDKAEAGDMVYVKSGRYNERVEIKNSGTSQLPILIEAERDSNGKRLVTVFGGDRVTAHWQKEENYYKTNDITYASYAMTIEKNGVIYDIPRLHARNSNSIEYLNGERGNKNSKYNYKTILNLPSNQKYKTYYTQLEVNYWDGIEAVYSYDTTTKTTYIRFRDGENPNNLKLYSSPGATNKLDSTRKPDKRLEEPTKDGAVFKIANKSYIIIRGFNIDGAQNGVLIYGENATNNTIEENEITNGQRRVYLASLTSKNHIRKNKMHMRLLSSYRPRAWMKYNLNNLPNIKNIFTQKEIYDFAVAEHYYNVYKREVGVGTSSPIDDCGVLFDDVGSENMIYNNEIYDTLGGVIGAHKGDIFIFNNLFHHISSVTFNMTNDTERYYIFGNKLYDVDIGLRVHLGIPDENKEFFKKKIWFYENSLVFPPHIGQPIYFSHLYKGNGHDYQDEPELHPDVKIYHNTIVGGENKFGMFGHLGSKIDMINNIFSNSVIWIDEVKDDKVITGDIGNIENNLIDTSVTHKLNLNGKNILNNAHIWNLPNIPKSMPSLKPPVASQAINNGIDLSNDRDYPLSYGYYKNGKVNIGAIQ